MLKRSSVFDNGLPDDLPDPGFTPEDMRDVLHLLLQIHLRMGPQFPQDPGQITDSPNATYLQHGGINQTFGDLSARHSGSLRILSRHQDLLSQYRAWLPR